MGWIPLFQPQHATNPQNLRTANELLRIKLTARWSELDSDFVNAGISDGARNSGAKTGLAAGAGWI